MDNEIKERTPYQVALDIYNSLAHKDHIDNLLWLQDRPLISCCLRDSKIKCGRFPTNLSPKDWTSFLRIADPKALKWTFIKTYGWVFDCIKKDFPELSDEIQDLFYDHPYITNDNGYKLTLHHERMLDFVKFVLKVKELNYPQVKDLIEQDGKKADKNFLKDFLKYVKANELFVRVAITINVLYGIFSNDEQESKAWLPLFEQNNKWFFNEKLDKFNNLYNDLKIEIDSFVNDKAYNNSHLQSVFKELVDYRRSLYDKLKSSSQSLFLNYVD